jgi:hypothetical protein
MATTSTYSTAVLKGLRKHGHTLPQICRLLRLSESTVRRIMNGQAALKDRHLVLVERASGLTAGQLAAMSDPLAGAELGPLMDALASTRMPTPRRRLAQPA